MLIFLTSDYSNLTFQALIFETTSGSLRQGKADLDAAAGRHGEVENLATVQHKYPELSKKSKENPQSKYFLFMFADLQVLSTNQVLCKMNLRLSCDDFKELRQTKFASVGK